MNELILILPVASLLSLWLLQGERPRLRALAAATALLLSVATPLAWLLQHAVLAPLGPTHLLLFGLLPMLALLAWASLRLLATVRPAWPQQALWLPVLGNGAALALAVQVTQRDIGFAQATLLGLGSALGFCVVLTLLADLQQRVDHSSVPAAFRGLPLLLISAGLIGLALLGLNGLVTA